MTYFPNTKIDDEAVLGLLGTSNSLAYKVHEIEKHFHSSGSWFGAANTPTATHFADRIGTCTDPFEINGGDSSATPTWGDWVQILAQAIPRLGQIKPTLIRMRSLYQKPRKKRFT